MNNLVGKYCLFKGRLHKIVSYSPTFGGHHRFYIRLEPLVEYRKRRTTSFGQEKKLPPINTLLAHIRILEGNEDTIKALYG